jgi:hypothetical protein
LDGSSSSATRAALGASSRGSSSRFATNSELKKLIPVRFPPGRVRLARRPNLTGSSATAKTMVRGGDLQLDCGTAVQVRRWSGGQRRPLPLRE